jgi:hypothetical protein
VRKLSSVGARLTSGDFVEVSLDMGEVHNLSLFIMECLEGNREPLDMSLAALALSFVRLSHPFERLTMKDLMEFAQMSATGGVN